MDGSLDDIAPSGQERGSVACRGLLPGVGLESGPGNHTVLGTLSWGQRGVRVVMGSQTVQVLPRSPEDVRKTLAQWGLSEPPIPVPFPQQLSLSHLLERGPCASQVASPADTSADLGGGEEFGCPIA